MAEYIEKGTFIKHLQKDPLFNLVERYGITNVIESFPSADVQPVRHGRWIQHYEPYDTGEEWIEAPYGFECSECGRWEVEQEPFCNCGAKMDGGET